VVRAGVVGAAFVAALGLSTAASGVANRDSATGTIERLTLAGLPNTVHVNASSGAQGEDARGMFWQTVERPGLGEVKIRGRVSCLAVDGNRAAVRGTVDESTDPFFAVGSEVQIQIEDNGSPGAGADKTITLAGLLSGEGCPEFFEDAPIVTILDGNFVVNDS
jgi:hypothetical protein